MDESETGEMTESDAVVARLHSVANQLHEVLTLTDQQAREQTSAALKDAADRLRGIQQNLVEIETRLDELDALREREVQRGAGSVWPGVVVAVGLFVLVGWALYLTVGSNS